MSGGVREPGSWEGWAGGWCARAGGAAAVEKAGGRGEPSRTWARSKEAAPGRRSGRGREVCAR